MSRPANRKATKPPLPSEPLAAASSYQTTMTLIRQRFVTLEQKDAAESPLMRAERIGLQVRKIVEGVAYGALSAMEHRNNQTLREQRTKDADKLLAWLEAKGLLKLPSAQRLKPPPSPEYKAVFEGAGSEDLTASHLRAAYSRASALIHERHPEGLSAQKIAVELAAIEEDAYRLRSWLWLHIMFLRGEGFLVQMGQFGSPSFMVPLTKIGDLPADL